MRFSKRSRPTSATKTNGGRTSLHLAAEFADTEAIAQLAARGADIEARDDEGCTPLLRLAMRRGEKSIPGDRIADAGRLLLDLGASLPRSGRGTTALIEAVRNRHHALAAALIDSGQRIDSTDNYGNSALHILCEAAAHTAREIRQTERRIEGFAERWASDKQRAETQRELEEQQQEAMRCYMTAGLLLDSGAFDPEEKNSCGKTPFAIASEGGAKWVSALLSGQDPFDEATMKTGGMDIFQALRQRDMEALGALLEARVDLQQECTDSKMYDFEGQTPLVCALRWGQTEAAAMLLRAGADPNVRTSKGTTAFAVLIEEGCRISDGVERFAPLVELFEANGWNPMPGRTRPASGRWHSPASTTTTRWQCGFCNACLNERWRWTAAIWRDARRSCASSARTAPDPTRVRCRSCCSKPEPIPAPRTTRGAPCCTAWPRVTRRSRPARRPRYSSISGVPTCRPPTTGGARRSTSPRSATTKRCSSSC